MKLFSSALLVSAMILSLFISGCGKDESDTNTAQKESGSNTESQQKTTTQTQGNTDNTGNTDKTGSTGNSGNTEAGKIWSSVENINISMGQGISSGNAGHLKEPVTEIINLLNTIQKNPTGIDPADLEKINAKVEELGKSGMLMDKYQHAGNSSELIMEYGKFSQTLNEIKSLLPPGSY
ncbi:MAG: hypothetical protein IPM38_15130 [Ignavibacteria bacterium]|nr:hypothetical protein [Ignavibacteria bacterium]